MRLIWFIVLVLSTYHAWANNDRYPPGCNAMVVNAARIKILSKNSIIMIHNKSKHELWLIHPSSKKSVGAGWSTRLQSGHWSALAIYNNQVFEIGCVESQPGHEQEIPCTDELLVCQYPMHQMTAKNGANHWIAEDMRLSALLAFVTTQGFKLPKSS
ncbi:MAG: hypothetical protein ACOVQX_02970 [Legionella sp.]